MDNINVNMDLVGGMQDIALLKIKGFVDTTTAPALHKILVEKIHKGISQFIIDLAAVQYVSSAGWGVFVGEIRDLREKGGDLKLIQMAPEVFEVFDMLEFNRILTCYDSLEEAIDDFDFCRGLDFADSKKYSSTDADAKKNLVEVRVVKNNYEPAQPVTTPPVGTVEKEPHPLEKPQAERDLPVSDKIKKVVLENPAMGPYAIKKFLNSPRFGYTKISYLKLRSLLKKLSLETKAKRYRYFRSR
jgi:anti-sigma B factor antagonist